MSPIFPALVATLAPLLKKSAIGKLSTEYAEAISGLVSISIYERNTAILYKNDAITIYTRMKFTTMTISNSHQ